MNQNEEASVSLETLSTNPENEVVSVEVETEVQSHKNKSPSLIDRVKKKMRELPNDDDEPQEKKSKSAPGYLRPQQREELSTLVASVFVMAIAASNVPDDIAPDSDEINGISEHLIKILARHVDLSKRLTGDVLDIIGIIAIASGWYARVSPILSEMRKEKERDNKRKKGIFPGDPLTPTENPDEAVKNFLNVAALSSGEEAIK